MTEVTGPAGFEEVLYYGDWWDCPRSGVSKSDGVASRFECRFSDELDDYPREFLVWLASPEEVAAGQESWRAFAAWRRRFDRGETVEPFEQTKEGKRARSLRPSDPPSEAQRATPEWLLDQDHSFAERVPRHRVKWHFEKR